MDMNLNVLKDGSPTHFSGTAINLTIASPELTPDLQWRAMASVLQSDHFPVLITMQTTDANFNHDVEIMNFKKCR